jgi:biotin-dependent carboxylase-like uncharacterized protein
VTAFLEVLATGPLTLVEDAGRPGHMAVGVGRAGAADGAAYRLGGRLLGNVPGLAALEVTLGGLQVRARGRVTVCLTGAPAPATVDATPAPHAAPFSLPDGSSLSLGMPLTGLRTYLSVRGGLALPPVLGSRSTDTMAGLGPPPVKAGDRLPVGDAVAAFPGVDVAPVPCPEGGTVALEVLPGPRHAWFARAEALAETPWVVSELSDRRGIRLEGKAIERHTDYLDVELPSEGMVRGAIQVPPGGQPVLLLNDHPVTGGYPVIGVVRSADVDRAAQLRPGQKVRLRWHALG